MYLVMDVMTGARCRSLVHWWTVYKS